MPSTPSTVNPLSGGSLTITDPHRKAYQEAWIGMADDLDGASRWLRIGGISEDGTSRLALAAGRTSIQGRLGINCLPSDRTLEVGGGAHVTGSLTVDQELKAGTTLSVDGSITAGTVIQAGKLALSSSPAGDKRTAPGAWTSLSSNAYHGDSRWHFADTTLPAVTLELDSRDGEGRFDVYTTTKAKTQTWELRLSIDGESGTVEVSKQLKAGSLQVTGDTTLSGALLNAAGGPYVSAVELVNQTGALPVSKTFKTAGRPVILLASGSGRRGNVGIVGMDIKVDGVSRRQVRAWKNEENGHQPFVPVHVVLTDLEAGDHTIELTALDGTTTDVNDFFSVGIIEL